MRQLNPVYVMYTTYKHSPRAERQPGSTSHIVGLISWMDLTMDLFLVHGKSLFSRSRSSFRTRQKWLSHTANMWFSATRVSVLGTHDVIIVLVWDQRVAPGAVDPGSEHSLMSAGPVLLAMDQAETGVPGVMEMVFPHAKHVRVPVNLNTTSS